MKKPIRMIVGGSLMALTMCMLTGVAGAARRMSWASDADPISDPSIWPSGGDRAGGDPAGLGTPVAHPS